jgi:RimJ/RimL family protein N-acetyltransferase
MVSERLFYERIAASTLDDLHRIVQNDHVRRYLMDGQLLPREWTEERIRDSDDLFGRRGVGLWLARERESGRPAGFCGFLEISVHAEPQLVYALTEAFSGRGLATEMARTCIAEARRYPGFERIVCSVDEANAASVRVLEELGFRRTGSQDGRFGPILLMELGG